ncbi:MAG: hypothetical protein HC922_02490 [Leptolyngbyaceae cyanobacterium SM2_3_12]|nr:hypothetical protein [Leptolyngbyaceae cyanobacterium SM2_3_12]
MTTVNIRLQCDQAVAAFQAADVDEQLAMLWQIYNTLGQAFAASSPVALFSQAVQQLLSQFNQVDRQDQLEILRDILLGADTRFAKAYGALNINMKLAFWQRLTRQISLKRLSPSFKDRIQPRETVALMARVNTMGLNERLHFLRQVIG